MNEPTPPETPEEAAEIKRQVEEWAKAHGMTLEDVVNRIKMFNNPALGYERQNLPEL